MIKQVIIEATQIITKCFKKNLEAIPGKNSLDSLQKIAILGRSHTIWVALQSET
jgi:hypothetical protein